VGVFKVVVLRHHLTLLIVLLTAARDETLNEPTVRENEPVTHRLMEEVALREFRLAPKRPGVLALQASGDLVNLVASKASGSFKLAALVVSEFHCDTSVVDDERIISQLITASQTAVANCIRENTYTFRCRMRQQGDDNLIMESTTQSAIRAIREKAERSGFTLSDVAYAAGIDKAQVSRWSTGKVVPLYSAVIKLQEACDALVEVRLAQLQKESQQ